MKRILRINVYGILIILALSIYQEKCSAVNIFMENDRDNLVSQESREFQEYVRGAFLYWNSEGYSCMFLSEAKNLLSSVVALPVSSQENLYQRFCRIACEGTFGEYDYMEYSIVRWKDYGTYSVYDLMTLPEEYFPDGPFGYVNIYSY